MTYGTGQAVRECLTRDSSDTATLGSTTAGSAVVQIELPRDLRNTEFKSEEPASFRPAEAGGRTVLLGCVKGRGWSSRVCVATYGHGPWLRSHWIPLATVLSVTASRLAITRSLRPSSRSWRAFAAICW